MSTKEDVFFTLDQLADRWGLHYQTILRMVKRKEIKAKRIGLRNLRVPMSEVERYEKGK